MRVVHLRLNKRRQVVRPWHGRKAALIGNLGNRRRDVCRDLADPRQRRIEAALFDIIGVDEMASVCAAAMNISSVTSLDPLAITPRPTPGKM